MGYWRSTWPYKMPNAHDTQNYAVKPPSTVIIFLDSHFASIVRHDISRRFFSVILGFAAADAWIAMLPLHQLVRNLFLRTLGPKWSKYKQVSRFVTHRLRSRTLRKEGASGWSLYSHSRFQKTDRDHWIWSTQRLFPLCPLVGFGHDWSDNRKDFPRTGRCSYRLYEP